MSGPVDIFNAGALATSPLITEWDDAKTDYQQGEWVATGGELFVSSANQTAVNDPSGDTGEHWTQYPARRAYEYSILADQFSSYQGTWADLINYYVVERGWTVTRLEADENEPPAAFDFNDDGNPITLAVGESVEYDGAQWAKAGSSPATPLVFEMTGNGSAASDTLADYFPVPKPGTYRWEILEYGVYSEGFTGRVSRFAKVLNANSGATETYVSQYCIKTSVNAGTVYDLAKVNDEPGSAPYTGICTFPAGGSIYLRSESNTGSFRASETLTVRFTEIV